jgi:ribose transport system substrate-binding protein
MRTARISAAIVAAALAAGLAACGGSGSSSTNSSAAASSGTPSSGGSGDAGVARAQAELAPVTKLPTSIGVTEPLPKSPKGKVVDYMQCGVTECKEIGDDLERATQALGIKLQRVSTGNTPESTAAGFDQAVRNRPDGVVASGVSKALYAKQLAQLKQLNIPVVSMGTADLPGDDGLAQVLLGGKSYENAGEWAADWAISDSKGKAKILLVTAPVFDFNKPLAESFKATLGRNCPSCSVHELQVAPDDIGKGVPGQIVSYLQQKPETNYVITSFGSLMLGVPQAIQAASLQGKANLFTVAASQADFQYAKSGLEKANLSSSTQYLGWITADQIARAMTGQAPTSVVDDAKLPWFHIFTGDDETWNLKTETGWPYLDGFEQQFKTLWNVQ